MNKVFTTLCAPLLLSLPWGTLRAESGSCGLPLPQEGFRVSSPFGMRVHPLAHVRRMHWGVDLASPKGTPVHAVRGGVVIFAGGSGCYGKVVILRHSGDVITLYAHLSRIAGLRPGMIARQGDVVGLVGATGCVTGSHLHFEWWESGRRVNPALRCAALRPRVKRKRKGDDEMVGFVKDLDTPLLRLSAGDNFTLRDACAGVHVLGGIGSGKTSGSGKMLAGAYLRAGFGGLVTAVKPDEVELWQRYVREHGREASLILFDEKECFNLLAYEIARQGIEGIGTVVECLMRILEAAKKASPTASQRGGEAFWDDATRQLLRYAIPPLYAGNGSLSVPELVRFINTAPTSPKDVTNPEWQGRSFMYEVMDRATRHPKVPLSRQALNDAINFWAEAYPAIPEKTRGNIVISVTTVLDRFRHGRLNRSFCDRMSLLPELTFHGGIILMAMPTTTWNEDGIIGQQIFKYMWQRAVLGRNSLAQEHRERPVFLWSDEAQETVNSYDGEFISICRSSKCCPVYLTQSLPAYYAKMGGDNPRDAAHSLVGKFMTHVYHSNSCPETNEFASRMIGKKVTRRRNYSAGSSQSFNEGMSAGNSENTGSSSSHGSSSGQGYSFSSNSGSNSGTGNNWGNNRGRGSGENFTQGCTESMEYVIEPGEFARILNTGGRVNGNIVSGVWFQGGRTFKESGSNIMLKRFAQ
jgi:hypothetical protein